MKIFTPWTIDRDGSPGRVLLRTWKEIKLPNSRRRRKEGRFQRPSDSSLHSLFLAIRTRSAPAGESRSALGSADDQPSHLSAARNLSARRITQGSSLMMTNPSGLIMRSISSSRSSMPQPRSLISENTRQAWRRS